MSGVEKLARVLCPEWFPLSRAEEERFWSKVDKSGACWLWTAYISRQGYGRFTVHRNGRGMGRNAHRVAYFITFGPIEDDLVVDHICRVRNCVNPDHLRPLTNAQNVLAGVGESAINARKTYCKNGHEFTPENTRRLSDGSRGCRECRNKTKRESYRRVGPKKRYRPHVACELCGKAIREQHLRAHQRSSACEVPNV